LIPQALKATKVRWVVWLELLAKLKVWMVHEMMPSGSLSIQMVSTAVANREVEIMTNRVINTQMATHIWPKSTQVYFLLNF
jgi:hypothetical protein